MCWISKFMMAGGILVLACAGLPAQAKITIQLDYTFDTSGFFSTDPDINPNGAAARAALARATQAFSDRLLDTFSAITPTGGAATWTPQIVHPSTGQIDFNLPAANFPSYQNIASNVVRVFVGSRALGGSDLGSGSRGGVGAIGTDANFRQQALSRGQSGGYPGTQPPTDGGPWGGSIAFDSAANWYFGQSAGGLGATQYDFTTVATHELAHIFGFSGSTTGINVTNPFPNFMTPSGGNFAFNGPKATAALGSTPLIDSTRSHWVSGTQSSTGFAMQTVLMSPSLNLGERRKMTLLDWAALDDIGYDLARPGDANASGNVDLNDLILLANHYGDSSGTMTWSTGDFNYDGNVDLNDLIALANNYGSTGALGADTALNGGVASDAFAADMALLMEGDAFGAAVPEPGGMGLIAVVVGGWAVRRGRRVG